ncbi:hypothetical protein Tco_1478215, partial [Tanacetum coccineum]
LRATYGVEFVSAASLVNTARPTLSTARLGKFGAVGQIWCCRANLVLLGKFGAAWQTFVLPGKFGAARQIWCCQAKFWNTASSQTVNDEKQIHATIDSKAVVVTEASIRSSLLFNDAVGTACLTNEAIFQNLVFMGYEGELNKLTFQKAIFSPQ